MAMPSGSGGEGFKSMVDSTAPMVIATCPHAAELEPARQCRPDLLQIMLSEVQDDPWVPDEEGSVTAQTASEGWRG